MAKTKRYNLVIPEDLFDKVRQVAEEEQTTVVEIFKRFTKLGLLATEIQKNPDAALIVKEGDQEKQLLIL